MSDAGTAPDRKAGEMMTQSAVTTGAAYLALDRLIRQVEARLAAVRVIAAGCDSAQVRARIVQRIVQEVAEDFTTQVLRDRTMLSRARIFVGGLNIDTTTGDVSLSGQQWLRSVLQFGAAWTRFLLGLVRGLASRPPREPARATLVIEGGASFSDSDAQFVRFCRNGPVEPLRRAAKIVVETAALPRKTTDADFVYDRLPLAYVASNLLSRRQRWSVLLIHLSAPARYLRSMVASPLSVLLGRDLALTPVVSWLDRNDRIDAMVTSTSAFTSQPLWMKGLSDQRFKLHMVWYSQNFIPKMYVGEEHRSDLPAARHMRIDVHWVWTEGFKSYLRDLGQLGEIRDVGPLLWYLPERISAAGDASVKIAVFDVTPVAQGKAVFGAAKNYYSVATIRQFISDIVAVSDEISAETDQEVLVLLKHKRGTQAQQHDASYLEFLDQMTKRRSAFRLIDHHTNLFGLLEECDVSLSVPYTSTAYVAAWLRKPAIYYDPFAELVPIFERNEFVHFASGRTQLRAILGELIARRRSHPDGSSAGAHMVRATPADSSRD